MGQRTYSSVLLSDLADVVGAEHCLSRPEELFAYECDALTVHRSRPAAVVLPESREQVVALVRACRRHGVFFAPRGAGTGLSGGALAPVGGVLIECSRMRRILEVNAEDRFAVAEPGVLNAELSRAAAPYGLLFAPDPSSQLACTLGGNVAENAGGPHTLKYGTTTNHVLALEVVLPNGNCVYLGDATGFAPGYDLVGACVGSEGTFGVVTQITARLMPLPEAVETLLAVFPDVVAACRAVTRIIRAGLVPAALEIIDQRTIAAVEDSVYAAGLPRDAGAVLLAELDGPRPGLLEQAERAAELARVVGAQRVERARDAEERRRFWRARKGAFGAMGRLAPDLYVHDAVVPRSVLPEVLERICAIADRYGLRLANVFHAGDGNLHPNISFDRRNPDELNRVLRAGAEMLRVCVEAGGVITGEHGVGSEKRDFMSLLFSEADLEAMRCLRRAFDPEQVCNPDKIFPSTRFCAESNPKARGYERVSFT